MKLIVLDGLDNSGKTWTIRELEKVAVNEGYRITKIHFPSAEICQTPLFKELAKPENKNNFNLKKEFIDLLMKDEHEVISDLQKQCFDVVLIDRFIISTLLYQGDSFYANWKTETYIIQAYEKLLRGLDIPPKNFFNFIFFPKITDDTTETNEAKLSFDKQYYYYKMKLWILITGLHNSDESNPDMFPYTSYKRLNSSYLKQLHLFNEPIFYTKDVLSRKELDNLTDERIETIMKIIRKREEDNA